ncbi:hypothetical protein K2X85_15535 [bacterium]|nr:hypothetical protein [bacterium]
MSTGKIKVFGGCLGNSRGQSIIFLGAILLCVALVRVPHLGLSLLNPDEAQYVAFASYLNTNDISAFDRPILHVYTQWLAQWAGRLFGNYELLPLRVLCMAAFAIVAISLGAITRRPLGMIPSLLGVVFFTYESLFFEGLSISREILCLVGVCLSWIIYLRPGTPGRLDVFWAGMAAGSSLWFKEQAIFLTWAIPLDIVYRSLIDRRKKHGLSLLSCYVAGGVAMGIVMAIPMLTRGTFHQQWEWLTRVELSYATSSEGVNSASWIVYTNNMYLDVPFRHLLLAAGLGWLLGLWRMIRPSRLPGSSLRESGSAVPRIVTLAVWSLPLSLWAFQLGLRMHLHYFLLVLPSLSILLAFFISEMLGAYSGSRVQRVMAALLVVLVIVDDSLLQSSFPEGAWGGQESIRTIFLFLAMAVCFVSVFPFRLKADSSWREWIAPSGALLILGITVLSLIQTVHGDPCRSFARGFSLQNYQSLADEIRRRTRDDDRLFVWGWRPELYFYSRRPAASSFTIAVDILADPNATVRLGPAYYEPYLSDLLRELEESKPKYIADAWLISLFGANYRLDHFPPLDEYVKREYDFEGCVDGCLFYRRRDQPPGGGSSGKLPSVEDEFVWLEGLLKKNPDDPMLLLTQADICLQEGRLVDALEIYRNIHHRYQSWDLIGKRLRMMDRLLSQQKEQANVIDE